MLTGKLAQRGVERTLVCDVLTPAPERLQVAADRDTVEPDRLLDRLGQQAERAELHRHAEHEHVAHLL